LSVILRKEGKFYLAVMHKSDNKIFDKEKNAELYQSSDGMEKLEYKLLP
jgi:hypothetical protein